MPENKKTKKADLSQNIEFLLNSYSNTLKIIQFFDTKAGSYVTVISLITSLTASSFFQVFGGLIAKQQSLPEYVFMLLIAFILILVSAFLCNVALVIYHSFSVLRPREGAKLVSQFNKTPNLFWAGDIVRYLEKNTSEEYIADVLKMTQEDIVVELSFESIKIAKITQIKFEHLGLAPSYGKWTIVLWVVMLIVINALEITLPYMH